MSSRTSVGALPTQPTIEVAEGNRGGWRVGEQWPVSSATKSSRLSSGRSREQCPHRPPFQNDTTCPRARKTAIRLAWDEETLGAAPRRATIAAPWPGRPSIHSKWNDEGESAGAPALSTHRVCGPPVKRCELGAMPRGGAISQTERVRLAEDAVLKTVAPAMVSKVRVLGAPPFIPPAWCNSSTLGSQPGNPGALPGAGASFIAR